MMDRIKSMHMRPDSASKVFMIFLMYLVAHSQAAGPVLMLDGNPTVMKSVQIALTVVFGLIHNKAVRECAEGRASKYAEGDGVTFTLWTMVMMLITRRLLGTVFTVISDQFIGGMTEAVVFVLWILHMTLTYIISLVLSALLWGPVKTVLREILLRRDKKRREREQAERRRAVSHRISRISPIVGEFRREDTHINIDQPKQYYDRYRYLQDINREVYNSIRYRVQTGTERNGYVDPKVTDDAFDILYEGMLDYEEAFNVHFSNKYYNSLADELNRLSRSSQELWKIGFGSMPSFSMTYSEFSQAWKDYWKNSY